ncbi:HEAT repeat domain-containing protein [Nannocystis punicea]|uniref:HEAT repeat domain-containing protein n=1 Tax=Nannocystis punicea TaxID=2995304 RepID=A0ABY7GV63_9BACT|nr:HEAT repeat domain-containing protein [Nannocystis poenicansa]WAS90847.1 HEAT repeat domain-containing protein [Nannocystis poenicansa]
MTASDPHPLAPAQLRAALASPQAAVRHAGLLQLQDRLARAADPEALAELAALLPTSPAGLPPPLQLRLAAMYRSVWTWRKEHVLPDWRSVDLEPAVAQAWLRLDLSVAPATLARREVDAFVVAALRSLSAGDLLEPADLVALACAHARVDVQEEGARLLDECLRAGLLAPAQAIESLRTLLASASPPRRRDALLELAAPWARAWPCPRATLLPRLADDDVEVACAAVYLAALHDLHTDLRALVEDDSADPRVRAEAFGAAMARCERDALPAWLALALGDPVLFGPTCLRALRALHRRAIFVGDAELPAVLALATGDHSLDLDELAALTFTARKPLLRRLADLPAGDPRWPRLMPLLAAIDSDEVPAVLHALLAGTRDRDLRRQILRQLGPLRDASSEAVVLAHLEQEPAACLGALRWLGAAATVTALSEGLGLHDQAGVRPHLCDLAADAAALLWHLIDLDSPVRARLQSRLRFDALPLAIHRDLQRPPARFNPALTLACAVEPVSVRALELLGRFGGADDLELARDLLRRVVSEIVAGVLVERDRAPLRIDPSPVRASEAERQIPEVALQAVRELGRRLYERDAVRPACLLAALGAADAGDRVLAELLLDLDDEPLAPEARAIVLRALVSQRSRRTRRVRRHLHRHLRHADPQVRAAAVTCLARHVPDDLCASLVKLAEGDDLPTARQALLALAEARATAAAPAIAAWLEHPNMNLKKTAAEALQRAGSAEVVPALVRWLGAHDNPGLRAALSATLAALLGDSVTPTLLAALDSQPPADPHAAARWRLWSLALDGRLEPAAVLHAARRGAPWLPVFLRLLIDGSVRLRGETGSLVALLHHHGLHLRDLPLLAPAPLRPAVRALRDHGLTSHPADPRKTRDPEPTNHPAGGLPGHAADVLAEPEALTPEELAVVRPYLREWLLALRGPAGAGALAVVLQLFTAGLEPAALRQCAGFVDDLAARLDDTPRERLLALLDALVPELDVAAGLELAERLRRSEPRPNLSLGSWLGRLRRCGAVLVRADLERALQDCAGTSDPVAHARAALHDAFPGLPALDDEARRLRPRLGESLRAGDEAVLYDPRVSLEMLVDLHPDVPADLHAAWLDRLLQVQPLGVVGLQPRPPEAPRHLPPPRSAKVLAALLARLARSGLPERERAADLLLAWPEPAAQAALLTACLEGHVPITIQRARAVAGRFAAEASTWIAAAEHDRELRARVIALFAGLRPEVLLDLAPTLIAWWIAGQPRERDLLAAGLRRLPAGRLLQLLAPRLRAGEWGCLDLLGAPSTLTPEWHDLLARAPGDGDRLRQQALRSSIDARDRPPPLDLAALRTPLPAPAPAPPARTVAELRAEFAGAGPEQVRQALKDMSDRTGDEWFDLLVELVGHASPRVRLQAHRLLRTGDRERYLRSALGLLDDPDPNIQRSAIRAVSHAGHAPAVAALIARLAHERDPLHREVIAALRRLGPLAEDALVRAAREARPDRRRRYEEVLNAIAADVAAGEPPEDPLEDD